MKEKDPNNPLLSPEDSPVPLPPVEDAWAAMRKKLDEEMPERPFFWIRRRAPVLLLVLLLPLGALWVISRQHGGTMEGSLQGKKTASDQSIDTGVHHDRITGTVVQKEEEARNDRRKVGDAANEQKKDGDVANDRKNDGDVAKDKKKDGVTRVETMTGQKNEDKVRTGDRKVAGNGNIREGKDEEGRIREAKDEGGKTQEGRVPGSGSRSDSRSGLGSGSELHSGKGSGLESGNGPGLGKAVIDEQLAIVGTRAGIVAPKLNAGRKAGEKAAGNAGGKTEVGMKKNNSAEKPDKAKNGRPGDSTRILYAAGLADGKSFPVGAQQAIDYNANLQKDIWFDYVPTPFFQFHPSRKTAVQVALQFNSPQYTEAVTIFSKPGAPPYAGSPFVADTVILVKKLYYFNFPVTVYFSPFRNLYLGLGLQYSNLRNGVAFQNNIVHYTGTGPAQRDTVLNSKVVELKDNAPAFNNLRKTDWRALFEMNYYWRRISLGVQYQQALGEYLHVPVPGSAGKDKNSSLNVFLRYDLWEKRVKIAKP